MRTRQFGDPFIRTFASSWCRWADTCSPIPVIKLPVARAARRERIHTESVQAGLRRGFTASTASRFCSLFADGVASCTDGVKDPALSRVFSLGCLSSCDPGTKPLAVIIVVTVRDRSGKKRDPAARWSFIPMRSRMPSI